MSDTPKGFLEVGVNENNEIVINHPDLKPDENGVGHIVFSVQQAQHLSQLLVGASHETARNILKKEDDIRREKAEATPVDRSSVTLTDGSPVTPDHQDLKENGQQKGYKVLSDVERAKGFVRPVRRSYRHIKCDGVTTMSQEIAETYARCPSFYGGTFCCECGRHFPLVIDGKSQFAWVDDGSEVGS